jgi:hypothetical protein
MRMRRKLDSLVQGAVRERGDRMKDSNLESKGVVVIVIMQ